MRGIACTRSSIDLRPHTPHALVAITSRRAAKNPSTRSAAAPVSITSMTLPASVAFSQCRDRSNIGWTMDQSFRQEEARHQISIRSWRAHRHDERTALEADLQRLLDGCHVLPFFTAGRSNAKHHYIARRGQRGLRHDRNRRVHQPGSHVHRPHNRVRFGPTSGTPGTRSLTHLRSAHRILPARPRQPAQFASLLTRWPDSGGSLSGRSHATQSARATGHRASTSSFDTVVAYDAGADVVLSYGGVTADAVRDLVHGAIFTRGPKDLHHTAIFIGGTDISAGERLLDAVTSAFFGPMRVSVMLDSNGANTTAVAAVASLRQATDTLAAGEPWSSPGVDPLVPCSRPAVKGRSNGDRDLAARGERCAGAAHRGEIWRDH